MMQAVIFHKSGSIADKESMQIVDLPFRAKIEKVI
jgi:hypothetical protein